MSLLKKWFGRKSAAEEMQTAAELYQRKEYGLAKLAYERALDARKPEEAELETPCKARIVECCDALARTRMEEADRLIAQGALELALSELDNAAETASSPELVREIEQRAERVVRSDARAHAMLVTQTDDERFELIAGNWEAEQNDEYASFGSDMRSALLALNDGDAKSALPLLERIATSSPTACYAFLELGRAKIMEGDLAGGREALETFLVKLAPGAGGDARLIAHTELAALLQERGETEGAIAQHQAAIEALPDDPRPYIALARFLRRNGMAEEAIEVIDSAAAMLEEHHQQQLVIPLELGLCHADLGDDARAIEMLEQAVTFLTAQKILDVPHELGTRLAELHEKNGNAARALDLYLLLAQGTDGGHHYDHHRQAARLFASLGHGVEARRAYQRALELAPEAGAARDEIRGAIAALG